MVVEYPFPQRSPEWFAVRLGKISGSLMPTLMKSDRAKVEWNDTQLGILRELASQVLTGERQETFQSTAMEWGTTHEEAAMARYIKITGNSVRECGFYENTEFPGCGVSPDGMIIRGQGEEIAYLDGTFDLIAPEKITLELKCPLSKTHMKYLLDPESLYKEYKWQVVMEQVITGADSSVICSFDPRFPEDKDIVIFECPVTQEDKDKLKERLVSAVAKIQEMVK